MSIGSNNISVPGGTNSAAPSSNVSGVSITLDKAAIDSAVVPPATFQRTEAPTETELTAALPADSLAGQPVLYTSPLGRPVLGLVVGDGSGNLSVMLLTDYEQTYTYRESETTGAQLNAASAAGAFAPGSMIEYFDDVIDLDRITYTINNVGGFNGTTEVGFTGGGNSSSSTNPAGTFN